MLIFLLTWKTRFPLDEIENCGLKKVRSILEMSESVVAVRTEKTSDNTCAVTMIDRQCANATIVGLPIFRKSANGASVILLIKHFSVAFWAYAVSLFLLLVQSPLPTTLLDGSYLMRIPTLPTCLHVVVTFFTICGQAISFPVHIEILGVLLLFTRRAYFGFRNHHTTVEIASATEKRGRARPVP